MPLALILIYAANGATRARSRKYANGPHCKFLRRAHSRSAYRAGRSVTPHLLRSRTSRTEGLVEHLYQRCALVGVRLAFIKLHLLLYLLAHGSLGLSLARYDQVATFGLGVE
jgi:hypothetical protein